jgi:carboxypeptidase Q
VVVGGHIDSWDGATGTTDNGTGTATTLEAARILMAIGAKPKRTIRFMLWGGEEQGLLGSRAWVQKHKDEMEKYSACLVHDGGTNYLSGIAGMKEMRPQLATVFEPMLSLAAEMPFKIRDIEAFHADRQRSRSRSRQLASPGSSGIRRAARTTRTPTTPSYDTYDAAIPEYQMPLGGVIAATGPLGLANLPQTADAREHEGARVSGGGQAGGRPARGGGRMLGVHAGGGRHHDRRGHRRQASPPRPVMKAGDQHREDR